VLANIGILDVCSYCLAVCLAVPARARSQKARDAKNQASRRTKNRNSSHLREGLVIPLSSKYVSLFSTLFSISLSLSLSLSPSLPPYPDTILTPSCSPYLPLRPVAVQVWFSASPPSHFMSSELRYCPSCQKDVVVADYHLSVVCTSCGRELESNQVSLSIEHIDKSYADSRNQVRDTSTALAYIGTSRGGNRPIADRYQQYKVCFLSVSPLRPSLALQRHSLLTLSEPNRFYRTNFGTLCAEYVVV